MGRTDCKEVRPARIVFPGHTIRNAMKTSNKRKFTGKQKGPPKKISSQVRIARALGAQASRYPVIESKQSDTIVGLNIATGTATWSALTLLNSIVQGAAVNQRIGRRLTMTALSLRWIWAPVAASTSTSDIRILVIYDKSPEGALPAITDILGNDTFTSTMNLDNSDRFMVLIDDIPMSTQGRDTASGTNGSSTIAGKYHRKFNLQNQWTAATTGVIGEITTGAIYIMWCTTVFSTATGGSTLTAVSRIRYTDA